MAVCSWMFHAAGSVDRPLGQKLMRPHVGLSYESRWHVTAYARVSDEDDPPQKLVACRGGDAWSTKHSA